MITDEQAERANDWIRDNATAHANAKGTRIQLMEFRKSKKALLMNKKLGEPQHVRESYAYAHKDYVQLLDDIEIAVALEEELRWKMKAAELKIEMWRTQQANNRTIDRSHA